MVITAPHVHMCLPSRLNFYFAIPQFPEKLSIMLRKPPNKVKQCIVHH